MPWPILFFADRLPPLAGGMEMHAKYFRKYFSEHLRYPLCATVSKDSQQNDILLTKNKMQVIELKNLPEMFKPQFVIFNSGRWIEQMGLLRKWFSQAKFLYRTGGNEILKAPLTEKNEPNHGKRQHYWVETLNQCINLMISNSAYSESRLRVLGLNCPFVRCIGGVNSEALNQPKAKENGTTIFCAARFVPYKNHALLLEVVHQLRQRGCDVSLRLAGEGPLLEQMKQRAVALGIDGIVNFLGVLDNEQVCQEIAQADVYMQFSVDLVTEVPGGSYVHSECMGRSILEALTAGTYVIAGRSGALEEIVNPERGMLVDIENGPAIVKTIEKIFRALPPRSPFCDDYSWEKVFKRYEQTFDNFV